MAEEGPVQCKFYNEGSCRFGDSCRNLHVGEVRAQRKTKKSKHTTGTKVKDDVISTKLPSMKTARDVIQRVQWDQDLPSQYITVGYLDRFVGIVEQPFDLFDWTSDLSAVDHLNVLAIPEHRIQYFKYRGVKVWDKNSRLDLIFCSTSSNRTSIEAVLRKIDEELLFKEDLVSDNSVENVDNLCAVPTHFLAVRIDDEEVVSELDKAVSDLTESKSLVGRIPSELYHCTLGLLALDSVEDVVQCTQLLRSVPPDVLCNTPKYLELDGLDTFQDRVLYASVRPETCLDSMVNSLSFFLKNNGVRVLERPEKFHVTLVKSYKSVSKLDKAKIGGFKESNFGSQQIEYVHLCTMRESPDLDGFYKVVTSVQISNSMQPNCDED